VNRRQRMLVIVFAAFVFVGVSLLFGRALSGAGAERSKVLDVLRAQARGDAEAVLEQLPPCARSPACARITRERTAKLRRPGAVQILNFQPSVQVALTDRSGTARVAWRTPKRPYPVVQCVVVEREGPLTGGAVRLVSISNPIGLQSRCGR
jgi:hypothetical protein